MLRSVSRNVEDAAKGLRETTTAPSLRSRNLGRRSALTLILEKNKQNN